MGILCRRRGRGGGLPVENVRVSLRRRRRGGGLPARSKMVGVWETGEGEQVPPPREPSPPVAISTRSTAWGDPGEEPDTVSHRLHPGYGCSPDIATHGPRPREGAGEERRRRGRGGGCRREGYGYPSEKARAGRGCRQKCASPPAKAQAGAERRREVYGYLSAQAGPERRREALRRRWNEGQIWNLALHLRHLLPCPEGIDDSPHIRHRRRRVSLREDDVPGFIDDDAGPP